MEVVPVVRLLGVHQKKPPPETAREFAGARGTRIFVANVVKPMDLVKKLKIQCKDTWDAGQVAVWSFKPNPADVKSGAWRKPVEDLARYIKAHPEQKTAVIIWHEPENDMPKWFRTPEDFVKLFNTVAGWMTAVHKDIWTCHAALGYKYGVPVKNGGFDDKMAKRWRTKARINTIDAYSGRTWPVDQILPEHPGYVRWRKCVAPTGDWGVTERGWTAKRKDFPLRSRTMDREFAWLKKLPEPARPVVYLVWATEGAENDPGLLLEEKGRASVKRGFKDVARKTP
jgi:hypothetical protein